MLYRSNMLRVVARDLHGHALRHARPHHVAHGGAPQVVEEPVRDHALGAVIAPHLLVESRLDTSRGPRLPEVYDGLAVAVEYHVRHDGSHPPA
jgi:hypothetical protein